MAIENLSATTLRNIIGDMELDETLTSREVINTKMRASLDVATDPWGIKVNRVELKNIIPPAAIQEAMEKQMKAERERREAILIAEGEKKSTILVAEGKKQSAILDAEAEKQAANPPCGSAEGTYDQRGGRPGGGCSESAERQCGRYPHDPRGGSRQGGADIEEPGGLYEGGGRQSHEDHHPIRNYRVWRAWQLPLKRLLEKKINIEKFWFIRKIILEEFIMLKYNNVHCTGRVQYIPLFQKQ